MMNQFQDFSNWLGNLIGVTSGTQQKLLISVTIILVLALGFGVSFTTMAVFFLAVLVIWILATLSLRSQLRQV